VFNVEYDERRIYREICPGRKRGMTKVVSVPEHNATKTYVEPKAKLQALSNPRTDDVIL
jgi:hypothetical protein